MGFPLAWKSSQSWHFHQRTLHSETSNCCLPCTTLPFLPWPLPREVYVVGVSSANDRSISSVIDHPPPIISPCGLLTSFVNNLPLPTDKVTPSLLLSCLKPLGPCPDLLRTLAWLGLRSLSFQSRLQSTFYQTVPYGFQFPPNHCFQREQQFTWGRVRRREREESAPRNLITHGVGLETEISESAGCWNAFLPPLMAFPVTHNWECAFAQTRTYSHSPGDFWKLELN